MPSMGGLQDVDVDDIDIDIDEDNDDHDAEDDGDSLPNVDLKGEIQVIL